METDSTLYVGLDLHEVSITVTNALDEDKLPGKIGTTKTDIDRLRKRLQSKANTHFLESGHEWQTIASSPCDDPTLHRGHQGNETSTARQ